MTKQFMALIFDLFIALIFIFFLNQTYEFANVILKLI